MVQRISYATMLELSLSWDRFKSIHNHKDIAGALMAAKMTETYFQRATQESAARLHSIQVLDLLDYFVALLGPEMAAIDTELTQLGLLHASHAILPKHLMQLGNSVISALELMLGDEQFTETTRQAWQAAISYIVVKMSCSIADAKKEGRVHSLTASNRSRGGGVKKANTSLSRAA